MKNIRGRVMIGLLILLTIALVFYYARANTIEDALRESNSSDLIVLYTEEMVNGSMVFYTHVNYDDLSISIVKKTMGRHKVISCGFQGGIRKAMRLKGMTYTFMEGISDLSFPVYYGVIDNTEIEQVKVVERASGLYSQAKMIETAEYRLWFADMSEIKGVDFEIVGSSNDGKKIISLYDHVEFMTLDPKAAENQAE